MTNHNSQFTFFKFTPMTIQTLKIFIWMIKNTAMLDVNEKDADVDF